MSVTPTALPSIDASAGWHGSYEYRWRVTGTDMEIYDLANAVSGAFLASSGSYTIYVNTDPNHADYDKWFDHGSSNPVVVTESNGEISLWDSGQVTLMYKFTKPTSADTPTPSWLSSAPPPPPPDSSGGSGSDSSKKVFHNFW